MPRGALTDFGLAVPGAKRSTVSVLPRDNIHSELKIVLTSLSNVLCEDKTAWVYQGRDEHGAGLN